VNIALHGRMSILTDKTLHSRVLEARQFMDRMSREIATITGGSMSDTILDNEGYWMRRHYMAFDKDARWNYDTLTEAAAKGKLIHGRDAKHILAKARAYLAAQYPKATPGGIESMMRDLTDRQTMSGFRDGSQRASKDVSSLLQRKEIPRALRELMGQVHDPIQNLDASISFQSQYIARHDQQRTLSAMGLRLGLFSTVKENRYNQPVGGEDGPKNKPWSGFYYTDAAGKKQTLYTTPQLWQALGATPGTAADTLGAKLADVWRWSANEAKMAKVPLNADSWTPNIFGNVVGMVGNGVLSPLERWGGFGKIREAMRLTRSAKSKDGAAINAAAEAVHELRRDFLNRMTAKGVTSSLGLQDLEATAGARLDDFIKEHDGWDRLAGLARGGNLGDSLGRSFGWMGRVVGTIAGGTLGAWKGGAFIRAKQQAIAEWTLGKPDRWGKIATFLDEYGTLLKAGLADPAAFQQATEKTLNTMPSYDRMLAVFQQLSRLGLVGSFIAFQHEVYRNTYWNARYAVQELRTGNKVLQLRALRRITGMSSIITAAAWGVPALAGYLFGSGTDDDKDEAYRRSLGAPWERFARLSYTRMDGTEAGFFNTSYLIPQQTLLELWNAGSEGRDFMDSVGNIVGQLGKQFVQGSVHLDPLLEVWTNTKQASGDKITDATGIQAFLEKADYLKKRLLEPGTMEKVDHITRGIEGRNTANRTYSVADEALRFFGFRAATYPHEQRMKGKLVEMAARQRSAHNTAKGELRGNPRDPEKVLETLNAKLDAIAGDFQQFTDDMTTLEIPPRLQTRVQKEAQFNPRRRYRLEKQPNGQWGLEAR
jgi:hypothetical protein